MNQIKDVLQINSRLNFMLREIGVKTTAEYLNYSV